MRGCHEPGWTSAAMDGSSLIQALANEAELKGMGAASGPLAEEVEVEHRLHGVRLPVVDDSLCSSREKPPVVRHGVVCCTSPSFASSVQLWATKRSCGC